MFSAPSSPAIPSEPNVLPVSPTTGSAASTASAIIAPHLTVANSSSANQFRALRSPHRAPVQQLFSTVLETIEGLPSPPASPNVVNVPSECNPALTGRAFRYQRRDASRTARTELAGTFDSHDTLSTFD